ncbi:hypothetical protein [Micromonospora sp. NPDC005087]|uniref:hypothetical protein n=1 Tax=Micromonospora sp. NPDC005087 TaxID=3364225 RepID=UPI0036C43353
MVTLLRRNTGDPGGPRAHHVAFGTAAHGHAQPHSVAQPHCVAEAHCVAQAHSHAYSTPPHPHAYRPQADPDHTQPYPLTDAIALSVDQQSNPHHPDPERVND